MAELRAAARGAPDNSSQWPGLLLSSSRDLHRAARFVDPRSVGLAADWARILERKVWMPALRLPRNRAVSWSDLTAARSPARENTAAWAVDGEGEASSAHQNLG